MSNRYARKWSGNTTDREFSHSCVLKCESYVIRILGNADTSKNSQLKFRNIKFSSRIHVAITNSDIHFRGLDISSSSIEQCYKHLRTSELGRFWKPEKFVLAEGTCKEFQESVIAFEMVNWSWWEKFSNFNPVEDWRT